MKKLYLFMLCVVTFVISSCKKDDGTTERYMQFESKVAAMVLYDTAPLPKLSNKPENAVIFYNVEDKNVASVDENGVITAKKAGQTKIYAFVAGKYKETLTQEPLMLTVSATALEKLSVESVSSVAKGRTIDALVTYTPTNTSDKKITVVTSDTVGVKYLQYTIISASKQSDPDTVRIEGVAFGEATFFVEMNGERSERVTINVTGEVPVTKMIWGRTPQQTKEGVGPISESHYVVNQLLGGVGREVIDTLAVNIFPNNTTQTNIKYASSNDNVKITLISYNEIVDGELVTRQGLQVIPIKYNNWDISSVITVINEAGQKLVGYVGVNQEAKYTEVSSIKFEKNEVDYPIDTKTLLPKLTLNFKDANAMACDTAFTRRRCLKYFIDESYVPKEGKGLAEKVEFEYENREKYLTATVYSDFFDSGYGKVLVRAVVTNPLTDKIVAQDSVLVNFNSLSYEMAKSVKFKASYQFKDGQYLVTPSLDPLSFYDQIFGPMSIPNKVKVKLMFKKDAKTEAVEKQVILLEWNTTELYWKGSFEPFTDGNRLSQYYIRYEYDLYSKANYWYDQKEFTINDGTTFSFQKL